MLTVAVPLAEVGGARSGAEDNRIQKAADALKSAMEATMKVFIEKYADKLAGIKRAADGDAPAAKKAK